MKKIRLYSPKTLKKYHQAGTNIGLFIRNILLLIWKYRAYLAVFLIGFLLGMIL